MNELTKRKRTYSSDGQEYRKELTKKKSFKNKSKPKSTSNLLDTVEQAERLENEIKSDVASLTAINETAEALDYLKSKFPKDHFDSLPSIVFQHQIYSMIDNRTQVDRDIEKLLSTNQIRTFKCDTSTDDVAICHCSDYKIYIKNNLFDFNKETVKQIMKNADMPEGEFKNLINKFQDRILDDVKELSVSQFELKSSYHLTEREITVFIQCGLLTIKNPSSWWFAIPFVGNFRRDLIDARKLTMNLLRKKKFKEFSIEEMYKRNSKKISQIGVVYLVTDLIGKELVRKIDSPMGFVLRLV